MGTYLQHFHAQPINVRCSIISNNCHHLIFELVKEILGNRFKFPDIVYHYTTLESTFHILKESSDDIPKFRFSLCGDLNDPGELRYALDHFSTPEFQPKYSLRTACTFEHIEKFDTGIGLISFSANKDDIPLWMSYGDRGGGFAIGIDAKRLFNSTGVFFIPTIYGYEDQIELAKLVLPIIDSILCSEHYKCADSGSIENLHRGIAAIMLSLKDYRWGYECEWRLIKNNIVQGVELVNGAMKKVEYINLGKTSSLPIHTYLSNFEESKNDAPYWHCDHGQYLKKIVAGPKVPEKQINLLRFILDERHYEDVDILKSMCPIV